MAKVIRNDSNTNSGRPSKTTVRETVTESGARARADKLNRDNKTDGVWFTANK